MSELDHEYDGIKELDNPLPMWWLATFHITIIFSFIYWLHFEIAGGPSTAEELKEDLAQIERTQELNKGAKKDEGKVLDFNALVSDPNVLAAGKKVYQERCLACHAAEGEGQIGPNLTDNHWIHGNGSFNDIYNMVKVGVPEKGMPAWENMISADEVMQVSVYIKSIKGAAVGKGRPPEGTEFKEP